MPARLAPQEIKAALASLSAWVLSEDGKSISRAFRFADFSQAFAFMTAVALAAEKADHHPDWSNSWNRVHISLSTHSAGGLTGLDMALALKIDAITGGFGAGLANKA